VIQSRHECAKGHAGLSHVPDLELTYIPVSDVLRAGRPGGSGRHTAKERNRFNSAVAPREASAMLEGARTTPPKDNREHKARRSYTPRGVASPQQAESWDAMDRRTFHPLVPLAGGGRGVRGVGCCGPLQALTRRHGVGWSVGTAGGRERRRIDALVDHCSDIRQPTEGAGTLCTWRSRAVQ